MADQMALDGQTDGATGYRPFQVGLVPCAVVIDTRNVHGQSRKVFGRGLRPTCGGVKDALKAYGFDAVEVYAGVATKTLSKAPSRRLQRALDDNKRYAAQLASEGVVVLSGHLAERNNDWEEKQVDVLLALQVADLADRRKQLDHSFECIVVLSEDMDLMPAMEFASRRSVDVYAAAWDTVHTREDQRKWLILNEDALTTICRPREGIQLGHPVRRVIARMATGVAPHQAPMWSSTASQPQGEVNLSNRSGITGIWNSPRRVRAGDRFPLFAVAVKMEGRGRRFPVVVLSENPPESSPFEDVVEGELLHWVSPTRARVKLASGSTSATISVPAGSLLPGQQVAVLRVSDGNQSSTHYIGPIGRDVQIEGEWLLPDRTAVVRVAEAGHRPKMWRTIVEGPGHVVMVPKRLLRHVRPGSALRVVVVGMDDHAAYTGMPVMCCIPMVA